MKRRSLVEVLVEEGTLERNEDGTYKCLCGSKKISKVHDHVKTERHQNFSSGCKIEELNEVSVVDEIEKASLEELRVKCLEQHVLIEHLKRQIHSQQVMRTSCKVGNHNLVTFSKDAVVRNIQSLEIGIFNLPIRVDTEYLEDCLKKSLRQVLQDNGNWFYKSFQRRGNLYLNESGALCSDEAMVMLYREVGNIFYEKVCSLFEERSKDLSALSFLQRTLNDSCRFYRLFKVCLIN